MKQGIFVQFLRFFLKFSKIFTKKIRFQKHLFHSVSNLTVFEMYVMLINALGALPLRALFTINIHFSCNR